MPGQGRSDHEPSETAVKDGASLRCHCGSLLARLVANGVEIKCRRCKRRIVLPLGTRSFTAQDRSESTDG